MVWLILTLLLAGFIFPPAWLGLVGYLIYLISTRDQRRNKAIETRAKAMVDRDVEFQCFPELYFEAAQGFAKSKGSTNTEHGSASADLLINGEVYSLYMTKGTNGGTEILVRPKKDIVKHLEDTFGLSSATRTPKFDLDDDIPF